MLSACTTVASDDGRTAVAGSGAFQNGATSATAYADFDQSIAYIDSFYQGSQAGTYTAQGGGDPFWRTARKHRHDGAQTPRLWRQS